MPTLSTLSNYRKNSIGSNRQTNVPALGKKGLKMFWVVALLTPKGLQATSVLVTKASLAICGSVIITIQLSMIELGIAF